MKPVNHKIIQRALAKALVNDTSAIIRLVNSYGARAGKSVTYSQLLNIVHELIDTTPEFSVKLFDFLIEKKYLVDYNNANYKNAVDPVSAVADAVSNVFKFGFSKIGATKERALDQQKITSSDNQQMMNFMLAEENNRMAKQNSEDNLIYISIGAMVVITGIFIFVKKG